MDTREKKRGTYQDPDDENTWNPISGRLDADEDDSDEKTSDADSTASRTPSLNRPRGRSGSTRPGGRGDSTGPSTGSGRLNGLARNGVRGKIDAANLKKSEEAGGRGLAGGVAGGGVAGAAGAMLGNAEQQGASSPFNYTGAEGLGKAKSFMKKHKKKLIAAGMVGGGAVPFIALLIFIMLGLKVPHFVETVAAWRFAKATRQYRASVTNVSGEKAAYDSLSDEEKERAKTRYGKYKSFDSLNRLRPNRVLQNLRTNEILQYNYEKTLLGQRLTSITIIEDARTGQKTTIDVPRGRFDRLIHPLRTAQQYKAVSEALASAMKAHDPKIPGVIRAAATKRVISKIGGSLAGLAVSKFSSNDKVWEGRATDMQKRLEALQKSTAEILDQMTDVLEDSTLTSEEDLKLRATNEQLIKDRVDAEDFLKQLIANPPAGMDPDSYNNSVEQAIDEVERINASINEVTASQAGLAEKQRMLSEKMGALYEQGKRVGDQIDSVRKAQSAIIARLGGELTDEQAKVVLQQEVYERVKDRTGPLGTSEDNMRRLMEDANAAEEACVRDPDCIRENVRQGGGMPDSVARVIERGTDPEGLRALANKAVGIANPFYDIATVVCIAYDGSKINSESIDSQSNALQKEALLVLSTGDQQKDGRNYTPEMANSMNWKLGDIQDTMAIRRVSGQTAVTTDSIGGQRTVLGTYGQYTIFDVFFGPRNPVNDVADSICPPLTNIWVGIGVGIGNLALTFLTGGLARAGEGAAIGGMKVAAEKATKTLVERFTASLTLKGVAKASVGVGRFSKSLAKDIVKWGALAAGMTYLSRLIVTANAGNLNSGLETKAAFGDNVDNGANQLVNNMSRANFYARPCTNAEIVYDHAADRAEQAYNTSNSSIRERYFALSNPDSLITRVSFTAASYLKLDTVASTLNSMANLFNPMMLGSKVFASANGQAAFAATNFNDQDYGNVQFCYSLAEERMMQQDSYASSAENELRLRESGKYDEIRSKYDKCFNPETHTVGMLLEGGDIARNEEGDVLNEGDCSPLQLSFSNPTYGDLVFRYRLFNNYENTKSTMLGMADPKEPSAVTTPTENTTPDDGQLRWPYAAGTSTNITSCFGPRWGTQHRGLDITSGAEGTPIIAAAAGTVTWAGPIGGYGGHFVAITHNNGFGTSYGHMKSHTVTKGQQVTAGQAIGTEGNEGQSMGAHLHFNVYPGAYSGSDAPNVNPLSKVAIPSDATNGAGCGP